MKKTILALLALVACVFASSAALTALHIRTSSQGVITLLLEDEPVLNFNEDRSITIDVANDPEYEPVSITFDEVEGCEYGDVDDYEEMSVTSVAAPVSNITVSFERGGVKFSNITDASTVEVYALNGTKVLTAPVADGEYYLLRGALPGGVYIVRIGTFSLKLSL
ncbi:MAG: T9SS type A sorting domain-containing protein [Muribaculaceae bacterium]|nr:T9SS type A sorting domain-containing protein [Muribaculaceae bacterium]